jgi:rhomboid protease GluP
MNQRPHTDYPQEPDDFGPARPQQRPVLRSPALRPLVTYSILGITIFVFFLQLASEATGYTVGGVDLPAAMGMKINVLIVEGQYWRLLTPMLLHGSILHIAFNMYALFIFGPGLERHYGHWRFFALYVLSGFAGNVISFVFSPANSLGSSTAIFGLIGAQAVFLYQNRDIFAGAARQALGQIVTIALINLFIGLSPGIDNWGHVGGLVGGVMFSFLAGPILSLEGYSPYVSIKDKRESRTVILAALSVGLLFFVLAGLTISSRMG